MSKLVVALLTAASLNACSADSPVTPSAPAVAAPDLHARPAATGPGVYDLSFRVWRGGALVDVSTLFVSSDELILQAHVTDGTGAPAQKGTVTFEYCSYKGGPPNDIARADEAPKEACEAGSATWARLAGISVSAGRCPTLGVGYACYTFGVVRIPRDVGFRFSYSPQGSGIAAGTSASENFTWVEAP
jgi:hypothetical protein